MFKLALTMEVENQERGSVKTSLVGPMPETNTDKLVSLIMQGIHESLKDDTFRTQMLLKGTYVVGGDQALDDLVSNAPEGSLDHVLQGVDYSKDMLSSLLSGKNKKLN